MSAYVCQFCGLYADVGDEKPPRGPCFERVPSLGHVWAPERAIDDEVRAELLASTERRHDRMRAAIGAALVEVTGVEADDAIACAEQRMAGGASEVEATEAEIARLSAPTPEPTPEAHVGGIVFAVVGDTPVKRAELEEPPVAEPAPGEAESTIVWTGSPFGPRLQAAESTAEPGSTEAAELPREERPAPRKRGRPPKSREGQGARPAEGPPSPVPPTEVERPSAEVDPDWNDRDLEACGVRWGGGHYTIASAVAAIETIDRALEGVEQVQRVMAGERKGHVFSDAYDELHRRRGVMGRVLARLEMRAREAAK